MMERYIWVTLPYDSGVVIDIQTIFDLMFRLGIFEDGYWIFSQPNILTI